MEAKNPITKPSSHRIRQQKLAATAQRDSAGRPKASSFSTPTTKASKPNDGHSSRPCPEHSFLTDVADVRQMEQDLLQLLDDFHSGKLQAFAGQDCPFEKMDQVREQQEKLARLHFELDTTHELLGYESAESREGSNKKLEKLMDNLQELCQSIQHLQKDSTTS